jgi:hypothetical protein
VKKTILDAGFRILDSGFQTDELSKTGNLDVGSRTDTGDSRDVHQGFAYIRECLSKEVKFDAQSSLQNQRSLKVMEEGDTSKSSFVISRTLWHLAMKPRII